MEENKSIDSIQQNNEASEVSASEEIQERETPDTFSQPVKQEQAAGEAVPPPKKKSSGVSLAAFICGLVGIFFNPLYAVTLAAIILGIVGIATAKGRPKGMAIAGLVMGCVAFPIQIVLDIILSMFTFGLSFCF